MTVPNPQSDISFLFPVLALISYLILGTLPQVPLIFILTMSRRSYSPCPHFIDENIKAQGSPERCSLWRGGAGLWPGLTVSKHTWPPGDSSQVQLTPSPYGLGNHLVSYLRPPTALLCRGGGEIEALKVPLRKFRVLALAL